MSNEIATPAQMIELAVKSNADLEKLEKLLEIQQRWEAGESRKAYMRDFALAQDEIGAVKRTARNEQTNSNYATLANVIEEAKPIYTKRNISIVFREAEAKLANCVRVHADIYHSSGYVNNSDYYVEMPIDMTGIKGTVNKTSIHAKASSITYARRYLMTMIFNIPTPDDDGNAATIQQPQSKTKAQPAKPAEELPVFHEPIKEQKFITDVHKITKKGLDFRILGDDDIIYISRQETFATLAKSAKEAGLQIAGTHRDFIIINIELVEPKEETQEEFLEGLDNDAAEEGYKNKWAPSVKNFDAEQMPF